MDTKIRTFVSYTTIMLCLLALTGCGHARTSMFGPVKLELQRILEEDDTYFETTHWRVILKSNQELPGSSKIRLRRPCGDHACVTDEEWVEYRHVIVMLDAVMRDVFGATMYNEACLRNYAYQVQPYTPLMHCHFYPRYETTVAIRDETFSDEAFGYRYDFDSMNPRIVRPQTRREILNRIKNGIDRYLNGPS